MLLAVRCPATNERGPLYLDQALTFLHQAIGPRHRLTLEYGQAGEGVGIFCRCPAALTTLVESQLAAAYPDAILSRLPEDALRPSPAERTWSVDLVLRPDLFPLRRYAAYEDRLNRVTADPLAALLSAIAPTTEVPLRSSITIELEPVRRQGLRRAARTLRRLHCRCFAAHPGWADRYALAAGSGWRIQRLVATLFWGALCLTRRQRHGPEHRVDEEIHAARLHAAREKLSGNLFACRIRLAVSGPSSAERSARAKLEELAGVLRAFTIPGYGAFQSLASRRRRLGPRRPTMLLSSSELATLWHPATATVRVATMDSVQSRELEPPLALATGERGVAALLGRVRFRDRQDAVLLPRDDRRRHMSIIGKTGMGKSVLLHNLISADIRAGHGVALLDPHGDLAEAVLRCVPRSRTNDVVYFDAGDQDHPVGLNPLQCADPRQRPLVASGIVAAFQKLWGDSWGPRLEYILRNAVLTLLDVPDATLVTLVRLLTDAGFRQDLVSRAHDPLVQGFWLHEFQRWRPQFQAEATAPVLNKVGAFLSSPLLRAIVGQPRSTIDLRNVLDEGKILIVNLSKGRMGDDASGLLGSLLVTSIQLAAMGRAEESEDRRRDFYLYVDEFQNFATRSFGAILSEARKYRLNLTLANQYLEQMDEETRAAVFGNVGSLVCFQVGGNDAEYLALQLGQEVLPADLLTLPKYAAYARLLLDGTPGRPFSLRTMPPPAEQPDRAEIVRRTSRQRYGRPVADVRRFVELSLH